MKAKFFGAALSLVPVLAQTAAHGCSVCITGEHDPTAGGFNASVLFLLATPYLVFGTIGGVLYLAYRRAVARREQEQAEESIVPLALSQEESGR